MGSADGATATLLLKVRGGLMDSSDPVWQAVYDVVRRELFAHADAELGLDLDRLEETAESLADVVVAQFTVAVR